MFISKKNSKHSDQFVSYNDIAENDIVVLDEEIEEGQHAGNYFQITNDEFVRFTELYVNDNTAIFDQLVSEWSQRGLCSGPIFGACVVRNNVVYDIAFN